MSCTRSALSSASIAALVVAMALAVAGPATAQDASPAPSAGAATSPDAVTASPLPAPIAFPIPESIWPIPADLPTVSLEPESAPSLTVGQPVPYALGHCGLYSPIDIDGSLWEPVGGTAADGGPIESDEAVGELINATDGELLLATEDLATFTTASGSTIHLARAAGALDYPLCM